MSRCLWIMCITNSLTSSSPPSRQVFRSPTKHYRHKCRFAIHETDEATSKSSGYRLGYYVYDHGEASVHVAQYPIASKEINAAMPKLLEVLCSDEVLSRGVQAVTFLSTTYGDLSVTLIYDMPIDSPEGLWSGAAEQLRLSLKRYLQSSEVGLMTANDNKNVLPVIGRSKGVRILSGPELVTESFSLSDGRTLKYHQHVDGFSNPNPYVNLKCLEWLCDILQSLDSSCDLKSCNLLEMYCGNGKC